MFAPRSKGRDRRALAGVDPIGDEELAEGQEAQQQIQLEDVKVAGEGCDDEHFGQIGPIRPSEPRQRTERHLRPILRGDPDKLCVSLNGVHFQAQLRRLIGALLGSWARLGPQPIPILICKEVVRRLCGCAD